MKLPPWVIYLGNSLHPCCGTYFSHSGLCGKLSGGLLGKNCGLPQAVMVSRILVQTGRIPSCTKTSGWKPGHMFLSWPSSHALDSAQNAHEKNHLVVCLCKTRRADMGQDFTGAIVLGIRVLVIPPSLPLSLSSFLSFKGV